MVDTVIVSVADRRTFEDFRDSNAYMAIGLQGQFIYVDPDTKTVVVKLSYFPLGADSPRPETDAFFRAVEQFLHGK